MNRYVSAILALEKNIKQRCHYDRGVYATKQFGNFRRVTILLDILVNTCVMKPMLRCLRQAGLPFSIDKKKGKISPE